MKEVSCNGDCLFCIQATVAWTNGHAACKKHHIQADNVQELYRTVQLICSVQEEPKPEYAPVVRHADSGPKPGVRRIVIHVTKARANNHMEKVAAQK